MGKLKKCGTCGQQIAKEANICPHCGAKNKQGMGCCSGVLLLVIIVVVFFYCVGTGMSSKTPVSINEPAGVARTISDEPSSDEKLPEHLYGEIKNDPAVEKVEVSSGKIKVIYKNDLPEMCHLEMRKLAQRGTKHTGRAYSAECSVAAEPEKILYFETRDGKQTTAIAFARNIHAGNPKLEEERLTEAKRQQTIFRKNQKSAKARSKFQSEYVNSWDGSCRPVVEAIKQNMNDAKSFEHIKTRVFSTETENFKVEMKFRGKNAYGGMVINTATATVTPDGKVIDIR